MVFFFSGNGSGGSLDDRADPESYLGLPFMLTYFSIGIRHCDQDGRFHRHKERKTDGNSGEPRGVPAGAGEH